MADIWVRPDAAGAAQRAHIEAAKIFRRTPLVLEDVVRRIGASIPDVASLFEVDLGSAQGNDLVLEQAQEALAIVSVGGGAARADAAPAAPPRAARPGRGARTARPNATPPPAWPSGPGRSAT